MVAVLYYYYYLFYTKVLPDDEPHLTVTFTLSFSLALVVNCILSLGLALLCNYLLPSKFMLMILIAIFLFNLFYFLQKKKGVTIVNNRPLLFESTKLSLIFSIAFFLLSTSFMFWGPIVLKAAIG